MARLARVVVSGLPHHVTHRGNRRSNTYRDNEDRETYLRLLKKYSAEHHLQIHSYCLMTNHIHLVVIPAVADSMAQCIHDCHGQYATLFNEKYDLTGHLWEGRFYSCVTDEYHFWQAVRYVERNPLRAGLVKRAEDYKWSSAAAHCAGFKDPLLADFHPPDWLGQDWSEWLSLEENRRELSIIREKTRLGRPYGSKDFIRDLEHKLGRILTPASRGPKFKKMENILVQD